MTSNEIKLLEEQRIIEAYIEYSKRIGDCWLLEECPIQTVIQKQLGRGDSIPDAILKNGGNLRKWIEVTTVSRNRNMRETIGKQRKGSMAIDTGINPVVNLKYLTTSSIEEISYAIIKKIKNSYKEFAVKSKTNLMGLLIIDQLHLDPFQDENELNETLSRLDETVLFSLGCGQSSFEEILLCSRVVTRGGWKLYLSSIADRETMQRLRERQLIKEDLYKDNSIQWE